MVNQFVAKEIVTPCGIIFVEEIGGKREEEERIKIYVY